MKFKTKSHVCRDQHMHGNSGLAFMEATEWLKSTSGQIKDGGRRSNWNCDFYSPNLSKRKSFKTLFEF